MPGFEGAEAPRPCPETGLETLVGSLMAVGGGKLGVLLEMTKLSYGSPIDLFANWLAQLWALNLKKSFHPLLNTAWISLFVLQGYTQYASETWIYTTIVVSLMTFQMPLIPYMFRFSVGSKPVTEFWARRPPSDTRADPHAHTRPHLSMISFLNQLLFGDPNSYTPPLFIWWTILYSETFSPVITNPVSHPPPLPRGIVGFN